MLVAAVGVIVRTQWDNDLRGERPVYLPTSPLKLTQTVAGSIGVTYAEQEKTIMVF